MTRVFSRAGTTGLHEQNGELCCEDLRVAEIAAALGTPCYLYSETVIRKRFEAFKAAFSSVPHRIFYSAKANHNLAILRLMRSLGAGVDVVSIGELYRAQLAGYTGEEIVFGGVGKRVDELEAAISTGVLLVNVESERELRTLDALAAARAVQVAVSVRVNPGVEAMTHSFTQTGHHRTKFGVALGDAERLYDLAAAAEHLEPLGIDAHIGSQIQSAEPYLVTLERLADLLQRIRRRGIQLRFLDIGGGFGVAHDGTAGLELRPVAEATRRLTAEFELICLVEPGRWLVAPAGALVTRVLYKKRLGEQLYYVVDAGSNDFVRPSYYGAIHPIEPVRCREPTLTADVVGPVCETGDFLGRGCRLPELAEGELLAVLYAGAYGSVMSSNYNSRPRAAEAIVSGGEYRVIRRRETLDDLIAGELEQRG